MSPVTKNRKKYFISILIFAVLFVVTFFILFNDRGILAVLPQMLSANPFYIAAGLALMFGYIFCEAFNIYQLTDSFGKKMKLKSCLKYAFIGFYFSSITPSSSGGQPAQMYYMQKDGIKLGKSVLSFVLMLVSLQIVTLIFGLTALLFNGTFVFSSMSGTWPLFIYGAVFYAVMIFVLICAVFSSSLLEKVIVGTVSFFAKIKIIKNEKALKQKAFGMIENYVGSASYIKQHPLLLVRTMAVSTVQVLCQFSIPYLVYRAFGQNTYSYFDIFSLQTILTICVSALPLPGAVGASEGSFLKMFYVIFGSELVLPAMLLNRSISFYAYLLISGIVSAAAHFKSIKK